MAAAATTDSSRNVDFQRSLTELQFTKVLELLSRAILRACRANFPDVMKVREDLGDVAVSSMIQSIMVGKHLSRQMAVEGTFLGNMVRAASAPSRANDGKKTIAPDDDSLFSFVAMPIEAASEDKDVFVDAQVRERSQVMTGQDLRKRVDAKPELQSPDMAHIKDQLHRVVDVLEVLAIWRKRETPHDRAIAAAAGGSKIKTFAESVRVILQEDVGADFEQVTEDVAVSRKWIRQTLALLDEQSTMPVLPPEAKEASEAMQAGDSSWQPAESAPAPSSEEQPKQENQTLQEEVKVDDDTEEEEEDEPKKEDETSPPIGPEQVADAVENPVADIIRAHSDFSRQFYVFLVMALHDFLTLQVRELHDMIVEMVHERALADNPESPVLTGLPNKIPRDERLNGVNALTLERYDPEMATSEYGLLHVFDDGKTHNSNLMLAMHIVSGAGIVAASSDVRVLENGDHSQRAHLLVGTAFKSATQRLPAGIPEELDAVALEGSASSLCCSFQYVLEYNRILYEEILGWAAKQVDEEIAKNPDTKLGPEHEGWYPITPGKSLERDADKLMLKWSNFAKYSPNAATRAASVAHRMVVSAAEAIAFHACAPFLVMLRGETSGHAKYKIVRRMRSLGSPYVRDIVKPTPGEREDDVEDASLGFYRVQRWFEVMGESAIIIRRATFPTARQVLIERKKKWDAAHEGDVPSDISAAAAAAGISTKKAVGRE